MINPKLVQLEARITELDGLASDVLALAQKLRDGVDGAQPELSLKGQRWYRGARELLVQVNYSGLKEFDLCYDSNDSGGCWFCDIAQYLQHGLRNVDYGFKEVGQKAEHYSLFAQCFTKARALVAAAVEELKSRYLPVVTQLSFAISTDEFETAQKVLNTSNGDEALARAAGVVARVALERHLFTTLDSRSIAVEKNPRYIRRKLKRQMFLSRLPGTMSSVGFSGANLKVFSPSLTTVRIRKKK